MDTTIDAYPTPVAWKADVKLIDIDRMGRLNLSYIDAIEDGSKDEKSGDK